MLEMNTIPGLTTESILPQQAREAGISLAAIQHFAGQIPILGVCLGHQAIAQAFGAKVVRAKTVMHGKNSLIRHDNSSVFTGLNNPLSVTRYHSLVVEGVPDTLVVNATADDAHVMGFRHGELPIHGVQFHPESIATEHGHDLLANFLAICGIEAAITA